MRILKAVMVVALFAGALSLGACAQKKDAMSTNTSAASTRSYSK